MSEIVRKWALRSYVKDLGSFKLISVRATYKVGIVGVEYIYAALDLV